MFEATLISAWVILVLATCLVPYYSRKNTSFGISVPESEYEAEFFKKMRFGFFTKTFLLGFVLAVVCNLAPLWVSLNQSVWVYLAGMLLYLLAIAWLYILSYHKVKAYKKENQWPLEVIQTITPESNTSGKKLLSPLWFLLYLIVIAAVVLATMLRYPSLPQTFAIHFDAAGNPNGYALKSIGSVSMMPVFQLLMTALFLGIYYIILYAKPQVTGKDVNASYQRDRVFKAYMANCLYLIGLAVVLLFGFIQLSMLGLISLKLMMAAPVAFILLIMIIVVVMILKIGQGGSRLKGTKSADDGIAVEDDVHWLLGAIYYNKKDKALFIQKRFGLGYSMNFGNPWAVVIVIAFLLLIAAIFLLPLILH